MKIALMSNGDIIQLIQLGLSFQKRKLLTMSVQGMMDYLFRPKCLGNYLCSK